MFKEHPHVIHTLLIGYFGATLCLELAFLVFCGYMVEKSCSFPWTMCLGGCTSDGRCVLIDLGLDLSCLEPNQVNLIESMSLI